MDNPGCLLQKSEVRYYSSLLFVHYLFVRPGGVRLLSLFLQQALTLADMSSTCRYAATVHASDAKKKRISASHLAHCICSTKPNKQGK
jgi:hypothetical protein